MGFGPAPPQGLAFGHHAPGEGLGSGWIVSLGGGEQLSVESERVTAADTVAEVAQGHGRVEVGEPIENESEHRSDHSGEYRAKH